MPLEDTIPRGLCQCGCGQTTTVTRGIPRRFVTGHNRRAINPGERSGRRVNWQNYTVEDRGFETPCHIWQGRITEARYGRVGGGKYGYAAFVHVIIYERAHGPIPDGHDIHHRCRVRSCMNLDHLVAMTKADHLALHKRGAKYPLRPACTKGHPYTAENTYMGKNGYRYCRACRVVYMADHRERTRSKRDHGASSSQTNPSEYCQTSLWSPRFVIDDNGGQE